MATVNKMIRPGVYQRVGVKNLGWFFRKARTTTPSRIDLWQSNQGWEMFADFPDEATFSTPFASFTVFREVMNRQRSLRGVKVLVHREDGSHEVMVLGARSKKSRTYGKQRKLYGGR